MTSLKNSAMASLGELDALCAKASSFSSDSREVRDGVIFVALSGTASDGARFIEPTLAKYGAAFAVTQNKDVFLGLPEGVKERVFLVSDAHQAHRHLAKNFRIKFSGKVIAVGGSNGKTSTKEFLYHILSSKFRVVKTHASQNGELGIPKTLEKLHPIDGSPVDLAVVEVGIDGPGDMIRHVEIVRPHIAILTSIGEEHLNLLKSVDGVFREERILADWCADYGGSVFVPQGDQYLERLVREGKAKKTSPAMLDKFNQPFSQKHFISNLALCVGVAKTLGMNDKEIQFALNTIEVPEGRGVLRSHGEDVWIYEDFYNANSASMKAGIDSAKDIAKSKNLPFHLVLGDMFDLGDQESVVHNQVLDYALESKPETITLLGQRFDRAVEQMGVRSVVHKNYLSLESALQDRSSFFKTPGVYLLKGSRGMKLELLCRGE
jgi:UDP-N-acetylmuramoyl-tripeptide--D-alanyl-D-alanine ligase